ncbi:MAG: NepR family anti-sigma factor [Parasphingopyxis sp.]|uniref:NepR family anti-sigma factor n=1 Tax=Parasphingopyxis sp. TaxID=1920299 RepID=UPI003FA06F9A
MASGGKIPRKPDERIKGKPAEDSKPANDADIGDALRSAYEDAVKEDIPSEMLDLLGKLD